MCCIISWWAAGGRRWSNFLKSCLKMCQLWGRHGTARICLKSWPVNPWIRFKFFRQTDEINPQREIALELQEPVEQWLPHVWHQDLLGFRCNPWSRLLHLFVHVNHSSWLSLPLPVVAGLLSSTMLKVSLFWRCKGRSVLHYVAYHALSPLCLPFSLALPHKTTPPPSQQGTGAMWWWIVRSEAGGRTM